MNLYFVAFSLYGLLILPMKLHFRLRICEQSSYLIRIEAAGFPLPGLRRSGKSGVETAAKAEPHALTEINLHLLRCLMEKDIFRKIMKLGHFELLRLTGVLAFRDAAITALVFSSSHIMLNTLRRTGALPAVFTNNLRADFQRSTPELLLEGIVSVRLGKLLTTFFALGRSYLRRRRQHLKHISPAV